MEFTLKTIWIPLLLPLLAKTEASGTTAAVSGTPNLANLKCFTFNPFGREALVCSVCFSAIFSGMLLLHLGKKNSDLRLPQEVDTLDWTLDREVLCISGLAQPGEIVELQHFSHGASLMARCQDCYLAISGQTSSWLLQRTGAACLGPWLWCQILQPS